MSQTDHILPASPSDTLQIDIKRWLSRLLSYWWLFLLSLAIAVGAGYLYLRYATYEYSARAILLIKNTGKSGLLSEESILLGGSFSGGRKSLVNEIEILQSTPLMEKVVEDLGLATAIFREGKVKETEFYKNAPFKITRLDSLDRGAFFFIETADAKSFFLKFDPDEEGKRYYYGVPFYADIGHFQIDVLPELFTGPGLFRVAARSVTSAAESYVSQLFIERIGDITQSSVLELSLIDPIPERAADILTSLINNYNIEEIKDENKVLRNTLDFIDKRVDMLTQELSLIEGDIERFKSNNDIVTESAATSLNFALGEMRSAIREINELEVQKSLLTSLEDLLKSGEDRFELLPANLNSESQSLTGAIREYNNLVLERNRLAKTASAENPVMTQMEELLGATKLLILETIQNIKKDLDIPIRQLEANIDELEGSMQGVPSIEKNLLERTRMQKVKETLFLFLLQKQEETALSEAVATANTRIIEPAKSSKSPVTPKKRLVYIGCFLIGLVTPLSLISLATIFDTRISSEEAVKGLTSIPIVGRISQHSKKAGAVVVKYGDRSPINEMFRQLRTNLSYTALKEKQKTVAITSFVSGEGKSFIIINLAMTLALSKKKVVVIELDLRKPKFTKYLGLDQTNKGVTNHLIGEATLEEVIIQHPEQNNLHIIKSGPIPPNPYELIVSEQMTTFLNQLKAEYDYILIDSPPIGLVSDALLLREQINTLLLVVRHRYTKKFMVQEVQRLYQNGELPNANIVLNGIKHSRASYRYGGYRSSYGKGYYK